MPGQRNGGGKGRFWGEERGGGVRGGEKKEGEGEEEAERAKYGKEGQGRAREGGRGCLPGGFQLEWEGGWQSTPRGVWVSFSAPESVRILYCFDTYLALSSA